MIFGLFAGLMLLSCLSVIVAYLRLSKMTPGGHGFMEILIPPKPAIQRGPDLPAGPRPPTTARDFLGDANALTALRHVRQRVMVVVLLGVIGLFLGVEVGRLAIDRDLAVASWRGPDLIGEAQRVVEKAGFKVARDEVQVAILPSLAGKTSLTVTVRSSSLNHRFNATFDQARVATSPGVVHDKAAIWPPPSTGSLLRWAAIAGCALIAVGFFVASLLGD